MTIDQRVVEMRFDNANFEKNVSSSLSALDKLKAALNFNGAAKGFDSLNDSVKSVNLGYLTSGVEEVTAKFSALEVMAITALSRITNAAIDTGVQFAKSLSVDQMSAGMDKYTQKLRSTATMVAQGYDMDQVEAAMSKLMWYADETSYDFSSMTSGLAQFTAQGIELDDAVNAMMGISNWAALTGKNAQEASAALIQITQAMGVGALRGDDLKSLRQRGFITEEFKEKSIEAAEAVGTLQRVGENTWQALSGKQYSFEELFGETLARERWLDTDTMMKVFGIYGSAMDQIYNKVMEEGGEITSNQAIDALKESGEQLDEFGLKAFLAGQEYRSLEDVLTATQDAVSSGWMKTWQLIFGDYEQGSALFKDLGDLMWEVFAEGGVARNEMLKEWQDLGGRDTLLKAFWTAIEGFSQITDKIGEGVHTVFGEITTDDLVAFTDKLLEMSEKLVLSEPSLEKIRDIFAELAGIAKNVGDSFGNIAGAIWDVAKTANEAFETYFGVSISDVFLSVLTNINGATKKVADFTKTLRKGAGFADDFDASALAGDYDEEASAKYSKSIVVYSRLSRVLQGVYAAADLVRKAFKAVWDGLKPIVEPIKQLFNTVIDKIGSGAAKIGDWLVKVSKSAEETGVFARITQAVSTAMSSVVKWIKDAVQWIKDFIEQVKESTIFVDIWEGIKTAAKAVAAPFYIAYEALSAFVRRIKKGVEDAGGFSGVLEKIKERLQEVKDWFKKVWDDAVGFFKSITENEKFIAFWEKVKEIAGAIAKPFKAAYDSISKWISGLVEEFEQGGMKAVFAKIGEQIKELKDKLKEKLGIPDFEGPTGKLRAFLDAAKENILTPGLDRIKDFFSNFGENMKKVGEWFATTWEKIKNSKFAEFVVNLWNAIKTLVSGIWEWLEGIFGKLSEKLNDQKGGIAALIGFLSGAGLVEGLVLLRDFITNLFSGGKKSSAFTDMLNSISDTFGQLQKNLKVNNILKIAGALLILAFALSVVGSMNLEQTERAFTALSLGLLELMSVLSLFNNFQKTSSINWKKGDGLGIENMGNSLGKTVQSLGITALLLAVAVKIVEKVDPSVMTEFIGSLSGMMIALGIAYKIMNSGTAYLNPESFKKLPSLITSIGIMALLLGTAIKIIGTLNPAQFEQGMSGFKQIVKVFMISMGVMYALPIILSKVTKTDSKGSMDKFNEMIVKIGIACMLMAVAVNMMLPAIAVIGKMDPKEALQGVGLVAVLFIAMSASFGLIAAASGKANIGALSLIILSIAGLLVAVAGAIAILAGIDFSAAESGSSSLDKSLKWFAILIAVIAGVIIALGAAVLIMENQGFDLGSKFVQIGLSFMTIAAAMLVVAGAVALMANSINQTSFAEVLVGAGILALFLIAFTGITLIVEKFKLGNGLIKTAIGFVLFASALLIVAKALETLGPVLASHGDTILNFAITLLDGIIDLIIKAVPGLIGAINVAILDLLSSILQSLPMINAILIQIITSVVYVVIETLIATFDMMANSQLFPSLFNLIIVFLTYLNSYAYQIGTLLVQIICNIINAVADQAQLIVDTIWNLVSSIFKAVVTMILSWFGVTWDEAVDWVTTAWNNVKAWFAKVWQSIVDFITPIAEWFKKVFIDPIVAVFKFVWSIISSVIKWIMDAFESASTFFVNAVDFIRLNIIEPIVHFFGEVERVADEVISWFNNAFKQVGQWLYNTFVQPIKDLWTDILNAGKDLIEGLWNGIKKKFEEVGEKIKGVFNSVIDWVKKIFKINSPSKVFDDIGGYLMDGLANGISSGSVDVKAAAQDNANGITSIYGSCRDELDGIFAEDWVDFDNLQNPEIKPVMDMSNIEAGFGEYSALLGNANELSFTPSLNLANDASSGFDLSQLTGGTAIGGGMNIGGGDFASMNSGGYYNASGNYVSTGIGGSGSGAAGRVGNGDTFNNTFNNTFNITGDDPEVIADAVARIIQERIDRREAVWA